MARAYSLYDETENEDAVREALLQRMQPVEQPQVTDAVPQTDTTPDTGIPQQPQPSGEQPRTEDRAPERERVEETRFVPVESGTTTFSPYEQGGVTGNGTSQTATIDQPASTAGQYASMLQGFDSTKLADATHTTPKYTFARLAQNYAPTPEGLVALSKDPEFLKAGFTLVGKDKIALPNGEIIDVGLSFSQGGNKGWAWQPTTGPGGVPLPADTNAATVAANNPFTASASSSSTATTTTPQAATDPLAGRVNALLMQLMGQDPSKVTESPTYTSAVDAYDLQQQRAAERERNAIAERMEATGTSGSGAYDQALLSAEQQRGENSSAFAANLALQEMSNQRNQIMQALQLSADLMTNEQKMALTERLAQLDAAISRERMSLQNTQFNDQLGWDMAQWQYLMNLYPYSYGS